LNSEPENNKSLESSEELLHTCLSAFEDYVRPNYPHLRFTPYAALNYWQDLQLPSDRYWPVTKKQPLEHLVLHFKHCIIFAHGCNEVGINHLAKLLVERAEEIRANLLFNRLVLDQLRLSEVQEALIDSLLLLAQIHMSQGNMLLSRSCCLQAFDLFKVHKDLISSSCEYSKYSQEEDIKSFMISTAVDPPTSTAWLDKALACDQEESPIAVRMCFSIILSRCYPTRFQPNHIWLSFDCNLTEHEAAKFIKCLDYAESLVGKLSMNNNLNKDLITTWKSVLAGCKALLLFGSGSSEEALLCAIKVVDLNRSLSKGLNIGLMPLFFSVQICASTGKALLFREALDLLEKLYTFAENGQKLLKLIQSAMWQPNTGSISARPVESYFNIFEEQAPQQQSYSPEFLQFMPDNNILRMSENH